VTAVVGAQTTSGGAPASGWRPGDVVASRWTLHGRLGKSATGETWRAVESDGRSWVLKRMAPASQLLDTTLLDPVSDAEDQWLLDGETPVLARRLLEGVPLVEALGGADGFGRQQLLSGLAEALAPYRDGHGALGPGKMRLLPDGSVVVLPPVELRLLGVMPWVRAQRAAGRLGLLAPELLLGESPSLRTDVYAISALLRASVSPLPERWLGMLETARSAEPLERHASVSEMVAALVDGATTWVAVSEPPPIERSVAVSPREQPASDPPEVLDPPTDPQLAAQRDALDAEPMDEEPSSPRLEPPPVGAPPTALGSTLAGGARLLEAAVGSGAAALSAVDAVHRRPRLQAGLLLAAIAGVLLQLSVCAPAGPVGGSARTSQTGR